MIVQVLGYFYLLSACVVFMSIGVVVSQSLRGKEKSTKTGAKIGIIAHHGMLGGMVTCNIFNMVHSRTETQFVIFLFVVIANAYLYWNIENIPAIKTYKKILNT